MVVNIELTKRAWQARRRYTILTFVVSILLLGWGAFVTSINAGMAVPDWPSTFNSYDIFNPWPEWWTITPVLAEHGHRLLGALVGLFTLGLAVWTLMADHRVWMRKLAMAALAIVILQGVLGGLRVIWVSLDLAVVHALVAQLYFSLLACLILFVSPLWERASGNPQKINGHTLRYFAIAVSGTIYFQIFLGALLRHPGTGIDPVYATFHIGFALVATLGVVQLWIKLRIEYRQESELVTVGRWMINLLGIQITLGLVAYFVILDERGITQPSNLQVIINSMHLITGALLLASSVVLSVITVRRSHVSKST